MEQNLKQRLQHILTHCKPEFFYDDLYALLGRPQTFTSKAMIFEKDGMRFIIGSKDGKRVLKTEPLKSEEDKPAQ